MRRPAPQSLAAAVVIAALAVVAMLTSRAQAPPVDTFSSTDFQSGGYRAWAGLLAREGIPTSRFVLRPIELDDRIDTLISAQPVAAETQQDGRTAADLAALASWVRQGGRLVYLGRNPGLGKAETQLLDLPFLLPDVGARSAQAGPLATQAGMLAELGTDRMLLVEHPGRTELWDGNGDVVVRYPLGHGEIVAVVDPVPFTNANIATPANARLAYLLGVPRTTGGLIAFDDGLHGALRDRPWYRALPVGIRVSLGLLALTGVLAVIGSMLRTGPALLPRAPREPTSVEFIDALASLHERIGARSAAITVLADEALAVAARANGVTERGSVADLAARVGDDAGAADIRRLAAMRTAPVVTDAVLLASAKLARTVRKEWSYARYRDRRRSAFAGRTRARRRW